MIVENSVSRSSGVGKRNYAMVLLASRLGLRASDIAGLRFSNIDWDRSTITLVMQKTGKAIELPLLADVGNAIIDYLQNGRPRSALQSVFLSGRAPYVAATKSMVCSAINAIICKSGIDVTAKHHGPHSLRHSLASAMLENGTMMPVISYHVLAEVCAASAICAREFLYAERRCVLWLSNSFTAVCLHPI